jgi:hypothetical protein
VTTQARLGSQAVTRLLIDLLINKLFVKQGVTTQARLDSQAVTRLLIDLLINRLFVKQGFVESYGI